MLSVIIAGLSAVAYASNTVLASNYIPTICYKIRQHWNPPPKYAGEQLIISFRVYRNGAISDLKCQAANDPKYLNWRAAMTAVKSALPFPCPSQDFFQEKKQYAEVRIDLSGFYYFKGYPSKKQNTRQMFDRLR